MTLQVHLCEDIMDTYLITVTTPISSIAYVTMLDTRAANASFAMNQSGLLEQLRLELFSLDKYLACRFSVAVHLLEQ